MRTTIKKQKVAVVVPCHIPLTKQWLNALLNETDDGQADVLIVDDSNGKLGTLPLSWNVFDYKMQKDFLGNLYEEFARYFHKCSACRVFGHLWAFAKGYDVVIGLDSDCVVNKGFVESHLMALGREHSYGGWQNPIHRSPGFYPRGYPYFLRNWKVVANMGLWDKTLDLNGADRVKGEPTECYAEDGVAAAPIPFSGMNFALRKEALAGFLFIPNFEYQASGKEYKLRRIDDIWGGYIFQKMTKVLGRAVTYGWPIINHETVIDAKADAREEDGMYKLERMFIEEVDEACRGMLLTAFPESYQKLYSMFVYSAKNHSILLKQIVPAIEWWVKAWEKYGK